MFWMYINKKTIKNQKVVIFLEIIKILWIFLVLKYGLKLSKITLNQLCVEQKLTRF